MVELYTVQRTIDGQTYEDTVCARGWEEAEELARKLEGELTGKIEGEEPVSDEEMAKILATKKIILVTSQKTDGYEIQS